MLPSFICIGTYRAGTTWLQSILLQHPEVFVPAEKEIMFFSRYYNRGVDWYEGFYKEAPAGVIASEICPPYLSHPEAPGRIADLIPHAKLFVCLRDPVEQVYSQYKLGYSRGIYNEPFEDMVYSDKLGALNHALYGKHIKTYLKYFDRSQILVLTYEHLTEDPQGFLKLIYRFMEVSVFYPSRLNKRVNYSRIPKSLALDRTIAAVGKMLRDRKLYRLKKILNQIGIAEKLKSLNAGKGKAQPLSSEVHSYLCSYYKEDRKLLGGITGLDLSSWQSTR